MHCLRCGGKLEHKSGDSKEGLKEECYKCRICGTNHTQKVDDHTHSRLLANNELYVEY